MAPSAREILGQSRGKAVCVTFPAQTLPKPYDKRTVGTLFVTTGGDQRLCVSIPDTVNGTRNFPVAGILDLDIFTPKKP